MIDFTKRNEEIYQLKLQRTLTLKQIGQRFGISGQRVRILLIKVWRAKGRPPADIDVIAPGTGRRRS